jgi:hypothetical protein
MTHSRFTIIIFKNVISLIFKHKHSNEILNILNIEMQESEQACKASLAKGVDASVLPNV